MKRAVAKAKTESGALVAETLEERWRSLLETSLRRTWDGVESVGLIGHTTPRENDNTEEYAQHFKQIVENI